jgi:hypothetical protein
MARRISSATDSARGVRVTWTAIRREKMSMQT